MKTLGIVSNLTKSNTVNLGGCKFKIKSLNQIKGP